MFISLNNTHLCIEGDNLAVIKAINSTWRIPWDIDYIITDVGVELSKLINWRASHCFRETNRATDFMATKSMISLLFCISFLPIVLIFPLLSTRIF